MPHHPLPLYHGYTPSKDHYQGCMVLPAEAIPNITLVSLLAKLHLENHADKPIIAKAIAEGLLDAQKIDYLDRYIEGAIKSNSKTLVLDYYLVYLWYILGDIALKAEPYVDEEVFKYILVKFGYTNEEDAMAQRQNIRHSLARTVRDIGRMYGTLPEFGELDGRLRGLVP